MSAKACEARSAPCEPKAGGSGGWHAPPLGLILPLVFDLLVDVCKFRFRFNSLPAMLCLDMYAARVECCVERIRLQGRHGETTEGQLAGSAGEKDSLFCLLISCSCVLVLMSCGRPCSAHCRNLFQME